MAVGDGDAVTFAIVHGEEVIGLAQFYEEDDEQYRHAGIDVGLGDAWHGCGLGTDTVRTLARHLVHDRGHHRLVIDPASDNARAIRCYEKVGFRPVGVLREYERGTDGAWHDGLLMDLLACELT
jgi:aminoglycoside 6'-N-acetyltransferase